MTDRIARSLGKIAFAVPETTIGTLVFPTTAAQKIIPAGDVTFNQQPTFTNSEEDSGSLDVIDRFQDQTGPGEFSIPCYVRPSGAAGTPPCGRYLYESLFGTETINAGVSVVYSQALTKPSVSLWFKQDHTVFFARGATVSTLVGNAVNTGGTMHTFSGGFMELGWVGTDAVDGTVTTSTSVTVAGSGKRFKAGGYVAFGSDDNTGAGYRIASVSGDTLTMDDTVSIADGTAITPFLPDLTAVGTPLENKKTSVEIDASAVTVKSVDFSIGAPVQYQIDEITTSGFPEAYVEDRREINGTISKLFRASQLSDWYDGYNSTEVDLDIINGDTTGSICTTSFPYSKLEVPSRTTTAPTISMETTFTALGSSGEDSCTMTFT